MFFWPLFEVPTHDNTGKRASLPDGHLYLLGRAHQLPSSPATLVLLQSAPAPGENVQPSSAPPIVADTPHDRPNAPALRLQRGADGPTLMSPRPPGIVRWPSNRQRVT